MNLSCSCRLQVNFNKVFLNVRKAGRKAKDEKKGPCGKLQMGNEFDDYDYDADAGYEES